MHSAVDDHSRWAYSEVLSDERGATAAGFIGRAADAFAAAGINRIEEIITDNHLSYRNSAAVADTVARLGARHLFIKPHSHTRRLTRERLTVPQAQEPPTNPVRFRMVFQPLVLPVRFSRFLRLAVATR